MNPLEQSQPLVLPNLPPSEFRETLGQHPVRYWRRIAMAIWLLASTGCSLKLEVSELLAGLLQIDPRNGSLQRLFRETLFLEHSLIYYRPVHIAYHEYDALMRLTPKGEQLARALGWQPVPSDWEQLINGHRADADATHAAAILKFCYYVRKFRGDQVLLLPKVRSQDFRADLEGRKPRIRPDVALVWGDTYRYIEVETDSDAALKKWQAIYRALGYVCVITLTSRMAERIAKKLQEAKVDYDLGDFQFLAHNQKGFLFEHEGWFGDIGED